MKYSIRNNHEPPDELDGARVIQWAWSGSDPFGYIDVVEPGQRIAIHGLAVCRYGNSPGVYRFSCDEDWEVHEDGLYNSIEDALTLPEQYKLGVAKWELKQNR